MSLRDPRGASLASLRRRRLRVQLLEQRYLLAVDAPQLLRDINQGIPDSRPTEIVQSGDHLFISADNGIAGQELLVTDGTNPPTLLKDIFSGPDGSMPSQLTDVGGVLYFVADDGVHGQELWRSDGTEAGTRMVTDISSEGSSSPSELTPVTLPGGVELFFTASTPDNGVELWRANDSGASLVVDLWPGDDGNGNAQSSIPRHLTFSPQHLNEESTLVPPTVFFSAETDTAGRELWQTAIVGDSTTTTLVKNLFADEAGSDPNSSDPSDLIVFENQLYFSARGAEFDAEMNLVGDGRELWRTDGTEAGTELVADILPGFNDPEMKVPRGSSPASLTQHNGRLYFAATGGSVGRELYSYDTGEDEPTLVRNIRGGSIGSNPADFVSTDGFLFFTANGGQGKELWRTDGTGDETQLTRDIRPGSGTPFTFTRGYEKFGASVIFGADDGTLGPEVWISDGTEEGTTLLREIQFGRNSSNVPSAYTTVGDTVYFEASNQLWKSDGTESGTRRFAPNTPATVDSVETSFDQVGPPIFAAANGLIFFPADDGESGVELWKSDGTTPGTTLVRDMAPGTGTPFPGSSLAQPLGSDPQELTTVGDKVFFRLDAGSPLMVTDGTHDGTVPLGTESASDLTEFLGKLFFAGTTTANGTELWMSNGTVDGTVLVRDIAPDGASSRPEQLTVVGNQLFFIADGGNGNELWVTDGTTEGTREVKDIAPGFGSYPSLLTPVGNRLFFRADDGEHSTELWVSDGTSEGTMLVRDIREGPGDYFGSNPLPLAGVDGNLLFFADDGVAGQQLWKSDGTTVGTVVVTDIWADSYEEEFFADEFTGVRGLVAVLGNKVYFPADDGVSGTELWSSDGTPAGTTRMDLFPGSPGSDPLELTVVGDQLFFAANQAIDSPDDFGGRELWVSDGTAVGTSVFAELNTVNNQGSQPRSLASIGGSLYFVATDGIRGDEVWTTSKRLKADDFLFEMLARDIAYRDSLTGDESDPIIVGDQINLGALGYPSPFVFEVDLVIHNETNGFDAYGLTATNSDPILLIRGSLGLDDFFSDLMPGGVGVNQFDENRTELFAWLDDKYAPNREVSITGHSLGGALTQLVAAAYTKRGGKLAQVVTFNAPGISTERASDFNADNVERVMHYITNGDPVSLAGEEFLEGKWRWSQFDDLFIVHNHQFPVLVDYTINDDPETTIVETRLKSDSLTFTDYDDVSWLNSPIFYHTDSDYYVWLAGIQLLISTTPQLQPFNTLPGQLIFRATTESARQQVGQFIEENQEEIDAIVATLTCETVDSPITAPDVELDLLGLLRVEATGLGAVCEAGPPKELRLQGQVKLPQINNATANFTGEDNYIALADDGPRLFGELTIDELPLLPGFWSLHNVFVDIRDDAVVAGGGLDLPFGASVDVELGFLDNSFNSIRLDLPRAGRPPLNKPIASTGLFLQSISGNVNHVATSDPEPISFGGGVGATGGPNLTVSLPSWAGGTYSGSLVSFLVNGDIDRDHLEASGTLDIISGLAEVDGTVDLNWTEGFLEGSGNLDVLDGLITANGTFRADSNLDINLFSTATFGVPTVIPLIGGYSALSGQFALDYSNDSTNANDFVAAWTTFDLPFVGNTDLGFRVFLDGSFGTIGAEEIAEITPSASPLAEAAEDFQSETTYAIESGTKWAMFSAEWDSATGDRTIVLTTPQGETITEADVATRDDMAIADDLSTATRRVVIVDQPEAGEWIVTLNDVASVAGIRYHAFINNEAPTVAVQAGDGLRGAPVEITIDAMGVDSDATVSLFYDTDDQGFDGIRIVDGLAESESSYTWTPSESLSGDYFIYAMVDDGVNPVVHSYAGESARITPGPQNALVYLPVDGGTFEVIFESQELIVRRQGGDELFRSPEMDLLSVEIRGVANVDDALLTDLEGLTIPVSFDGGTSGQNAYALAGAGQSIDLSLSTDLALQNIDLIDVTGNGDNQLAIRALEVQALSPEDSTLRVRHDDGDLILYSGVGWQVDAPTFDEELWHVLTNGSARVETANTQPHRNPLSPTDINLSGDTTPRDALQIINFLARAGTPMVPLPAPTSFAELPERYYDVNGSGFASPLDALRVINFIERSFAAGNAVPIEAEGESVSSNSPMIQSAFLPGKRLDGEQVAPRIEPETLPGPMKPDRPTSDTDLPETRLRPSDLIEDDDPEAEYRIDGDGWELAVDDLMTGLGV